ncbi:hypothetical protein CLV80_11418 [Yoonia maritima]|uniref:Uncharacterized protein n=1 Tax=Yoonia maritima TaxID=1435347 RepID=A0A2T0VUB6_9RHOB|nr:hypothetical protein [Yoonia maritima]PRY74982.1 hypothetical protein CLV80_11418 [Yoonia maritima]
MHRVLIALSLLSACSTNANHIGNPLMLPVSGIFTGIGNAAYNQRRGQVEIFVKTNHPAIVNDIQNGGGQTVNEAMDIAQIRAGDRPARLIQLKSDIGIYQNSPDALIVALMVYAS